jgi:hypothetical protein
MNKDTAEPIIFIENSIGFAPVIENINKTYPLIKRLVYVALFGGEDWGHLLLHHYRFNHRTDYDKKSNNAGINGGSLPLLIDNQYHTIRSDGNYFFITLK